MLSNIKFAAAQFPDTPFQNYVFVTDIRTLQIGDPVVVDTINGLKVATFKGYVSKFPASIPVAKARWVIQKVDLNKHKERSMQEIIELQKLLKKQELEVQCNELLEQAREIQRKISEL